jgi:hypothetical protein
MTAGRATSPRSLALAEAARLVGIGDQSLGAFLGPIPFGRERVGLRWLS